MYQRNVEYARKKSRNFDQKRGKNRIIFDLNFWGLTTILTTNFVKKGVYRVLNVYELTGDDVRKMGNGAYMVMVAFGIAMMPYVQD